MSAVPRQRPRRSDVRAAVLAEAIRSFEHTGYAGTTLAGVAAAAGFTKGAVYSSFGGKAALFAEACRVRQEEISRDLMTRLEPVIAAPPAERAGQISAALASATLDAPVRWQQLLSEFRAVALHDPEVGVVYAELSRARVAFLADLFVTDPILARLERPTLERAALALLSLVNTFALEHSATPDLVDRTTVTEVFAAFLTAVLSSPD